VAVAFLSKDSFYHRLCESFVDYSVRWIRCHVYRLVYAQMMSDSNASFTYDYNGNTMSKTVSGGTTDYSWDYENRIMGITLPGSGGILTFKYDPFGRNAIRIP
jgi:hypothetical protein